jgi:hypothetical protein
MTDNINIDFFGYLAVSSYSQIESAVLEDASIEPFDPEKLSIDPNSGLLSEDAQEAIAKAGLSNLPDHIRQSDSQNAIEYSKSLAQNNLTADAGLDNNTEASAYSDLLGSYS